MGDLANEYYEYYYYDSFYNMTDEWRGNCSTDSTFWDDHCWEKFIDHYWGDWEYEQYDSSTSSPWEDPDFVDYWDEVWDYCRNLSVWDNYCEEKYDYYMDLANEYYEYYYYDSFYNMTDEWRGNCSTDSTFWDDHCWEKFIDHYWGDWEYEQYDSSTSSPWDDQYTNEYYDWVSDLRNQWWGNCTDDSDSWDNYCWEKYDYYWYYVWDLYDTWEGMFDHLFN